MHSSTTLLGMFAFLFAVLALGGSSARTTVSAFQTPALVVSPSQSSALFRRVASSASVRSPSTAAITQTLKAASPAAKVESTTALQAAGAANYASQAISLFGNMRTVASLIAGTLVPIALIAPLALKNQQNEVQETRWQRALRLSYPIIAMLSLLSQLTAAIIATVAVNQLSETTVAPAKSVWHLILRDYDLAWSGTYV